MNAAQYIGEQVLGNGDLGHLEGDIAPVAHDLAANLDQPVPNSESDESSVAVSTGIRQAGYDSADLGTELASPPPGCPSGPTPDDNVGVQPADPTLDDHAPESHPNGGWGQGGFGAGSWGGNVEQLPTPEAVYRAAQNLYASYYKLVI